MYSVGIDVDAASNFIEVGLTNIDYGSFTSVIASSKVYYNGAPVTNDPFGTGNVRTGVLG